MLSYGNNQTNQTLMTDLLKSLVNIFLAHNPSKKEAGIE